MVIGERTRDKVLRAYIQPSTVSDVCKALDEAYRVVWWHTRRLYAAGLLRECGKRSGRSIYESDRAAIRASLAEVRAAQRAMLEDIGESAVILWLRTRGYTVRRDELPACYPPMGDDDNV